MSTVKSAGKVQCVVVTPERALLDERADFVALPLYDGEIGVLPGRAPLVGRLGVGELRLKQGTETRRYYIDGGFVQIRENVITVLTSRALRPAEIDAVAQEQALQQVATAGPKAPEERLKSQQRLRAQIRVARAAQANKEV